MANRKAQWEIERDYQPVWNGALDKKRQIEAAQGVPEGERSTFSLLAIDEEDAYGQLHGTAAQESASRGESVLAAEDVSLRRAVRAAGEGRMRFR